MAGELDLWIPEPVKDPELRASIERLGAIMAGASDESPPNTAPPSTGNIIQFPLFPQETRPVSNDMARSALVSCVPGNKRRWLKNAVLATVGDIRIEFTGEQLNQDDCDTLMQLVFMARHNPPSPLVMVSAS